MHEAGLSAGRLWLSGISRVASPYDLNPCGHNPLRAVRVSGTISFIGLIAELIIHTRRARGPEDFAEER